VTLSDALDVYVRLKGGEKGIKFIHHATRSANYTIEAIGNLDLCSYDGKSRGVLRDALLERGLASSSAKRIFASVRAMVNFIICEHGLKVANPFLNVFLCLGFELIKASKSLTTITPLLYYDTVT
jgi:hypothetical protein